jgi:hypothetical protein
MSSSKHDIDEGQAKELAGEAELLSEEGWQQDSSEWEAKHSNTDNDTAKGKSTGKGWQKDKSTGKGWQREGPYTGREVVVAIPSSSSMSTGHSALTAMVRCEAAARTAARMSRSAATGFDAEADVLATEIVKLKACTQ